MDRFEAMRTLLAAIDGGSLSAAARALNAPLPTVSRRVADLEAHLKTQLVVRTSRALQLTDAGRDYVAAARRILDALDGAERAAAGEYRAPRGDLLVTASIVFGKLYVAPIIVDFLNAYPDVNVKLVLSDAVVDLVETHVDVAVRFGRLKDSSLVATRVGAIHVISCASPDYLARRGEPQRPEDLEAHSCIAFDGVVDPRRWDFARDGAAVDVDVAPRLVTNTAEPAVAAAIAGLGVARLVSYQIAADVRAGRLRLVLGDFMPEPYPVHLVHTGPALLPLKLRAFLDFATPRLKATCSDIAATLGLA